MTSLMAIASTAKSSFSWDNTLAYFDSVKFWEYADLNNLLFITITGLLIFALGWVILKIMVKTIRKIFSRAKNMSDLLGDYIIKVITVLGWIIIIATFLSHIGIDMGPVIAGIGVTGIVLGLALQDSISNFFAGFMIIVNQPFRKGDYIEVNTLSGTVKSMDLVCVQLTTFDGKLITMSNKVVWDSPVTNYSFTDKRRIGFQIGVPYDTDLKVAKQVFIDLIDTYPEILKDPAPTIEINEFADSSINFVIRPWVKPEDYWNVYWRFNSEVLGKLAEKNIFLPFPQIDIHMPDSIT
jgi:small conductance mechanosensitive channel